MRRKRKCEINLAELALELNAEVRGADDPATRRVTGLSTLDAAGPDDLTFVASAKHLDQAANSRGGAFIVDPQTVVEGRPCLVVDHVWKAVLAVMEMFYPDTPAEPGVHPTAVVDESACISPTAAVGPLCVVEANAVIGEGVQIGAQCFVGRDALIGDGSLLHPGVRVLEATEIGRGVILHSGVVLGADGYGYEIIDGLPVKVPQVGKVVIEDGVEIGANSCVDRAFLIETRVGAGCKIDNLVQIAHNCHIGRMCGFAAQVGIAGSTTIGDGCMFWGQAGVKDHSTIGSRVEIMGQSAPAGDVADGERLLGSPAYPLNEAARLISAQRRLPDLMKRMRQLEKKIEKLEGEA